jgi:hypothetical protein
MLIVYVMNMYWVASLDILLEYTSKSRRYRMTHAEARHPLKLHRIPCCPIAGSYAVSDIRIESRCLGLEVPICVMVSHHPLWQKMVP